MFGRSQRTETGMRPALPLPLLVVWLSACGAERPEGVQLDAFSLATVTTAEGHDMPVFIDPRPLHLPDGVVYPDTTHYLPISATAARERSAALARNALDEAPVFPLLPDCDGYLVLPKRTAGCPSSPFVRVGFGTARVLDPSEDLWELRKIEFHYGPNGRGTTTYSVVLRSRDGAWEWVREDVLVIFD